jgi:hypothetical protein
MQNGHSHQRLPLQHGPVTQQALHLQVTLGIAAIVQPRSKLAHVGAGSESGHQMCSLGVGLAGQNAPPDRRLRAGGDEGTQVWHTRHLAELQA